jgi:hypothetical protein
VTGEFSASDTYGHFNLYTNYDATYTVYENDSSQATGSVTKHTDYIRWGINNNKGVHVDVGIKFSITDYSGAIWRNWSYSNAEDSPLAITDFDFTQDWWYIHITVYTNWANTSVTIIDSYYDGIQWENTTVYNAVAEGSYDYEIDQQHDSNRGNHTVYITIDGGADSVSKTMYYLYSRDYPYVAIPPTPQVTVGNVMVIMGLLFLGIALFIVIRQSATLSPTRRVASMAKGAYTPPTGRKKPPKTRRDTRDVHEKKYDSLTEHYDLVTEADR